MRILITALILLFVTTLNAQVKVKQTSNGNFTSYVVRDTTTKVSKPTGKTYTDSKGEVYPVYESINGKLYIIRTSKKSGNQYKQYLKLS